MLTHGNGSKGSGLPDTDMPPVRLPRSVVEALDEFRQLQSDRPSRSDAVRIVLTSWLLEKGYLNSF